MPNFREPIEIHSILHKEARCIFYKERSFLMEKNKLCNGSPISREREWCQVEDVLGIELQSTMYCLFFPLL